MRSQTPSSRQWNTGRAMSPRVYRAALLAAALTAVAVTAVVGLSTAAWIGKPFPGFFVLPNRVIPSVGADLWSGTRDGTIFQRVVVAVDGKRVVGNADAYRRVAERAPGAPIAYTLGGDGRTETLTLDSRTFSA